MPTKNIWQSQNPAQVFYGGTGDATLTPTYSVLCSGTTTTNPVQVVASVGTAGQVLTSNGLSVLPTWNDLATTGPALVLLQTQTAANSASLTFTAGFSNTYRNYMVVLTGITPVVDGDYFNMQWSDTGGASYTNIGYVWGAYYAGSISSTIPNTDNPQTIIVPAGDTQFSLGPSANEVHPVGISSTHGFYTTLWLMDFNGSGNPTYWGEFFTNGTLTGGPTARNIWGYLGGGLPGGGYFGDALTFYFSGGNIAYGVISVYGFLE